MNEVMMLVLLLEAALNATATAEWISALTSAGTLFVSFGTLMVAIVAAWYAKGQVERAKDQIQSSRDDADKTRQLQRDLLTAQAQPYVVTSFEQSTSASEFIDLVVKNYGTTAARDISLKIWPPPRRALGNKGGARTFPIPEKISILAPGQEWRAFWDSGHSHLKEKLPDRYTATVTYKGVEEQQLTTESVLDWNFLGFEQMVIFGVHDLTKSLRDINKTFKSLVDGPRQLRVVLTDTKLMKRRMREQATRWRGKHTPPPSSNEPAEAPIRRIERIRRAISSRKC